MEDLKDARGLWGRLDTCTRMAESLCCPEAITTLLIARVQIQQPGIQPEGRDGVGE